VATLSGTTFASRYSFTMSVAARFCRSVHAGGSALPASAFTRSSCSARMPWPYRLRSVLSSSFETASHAAAEWDAVSKELDNTLRILYGQGIRAEQLDLVKADAGKALPPAWTDRQKRAATDIVKEHLDANLAPDHVAP